MADHLLRALGLEGRVRAVAAVTTDTAEELRHIHDPSPEVSAALARTATGALLLAALLEKVTTREPVLTLELEGGGPAGRLIATASPAGWVRATVSNPRASTSQAPDDPLTVAGVVGSTGQLAVTRDPGIGEPYRGVVPLTTGEIATDLAHYLDDSEQHPTAVVLGVQVLPEGRVGHSGGLLLQILPGVSDDEASELGERVRALHGVTDRLLHGEGPRQWLARLFPAGVWALDETPVRFLCGCSEERVETALKLLGSREIRALIARSTEHVTTLTCGFCHASYTVPFERLRTLLEEVRAERRSLN
jgi:molecular chaperone Hsp33